MRAPFPFIVLFMVGLLFFTGCSTTDSGRGEDRNIVPALPQEISQGGPYVRKKPRQPQVAYKEESIVEANDYEETSLGDEEFSTYTVEKGDTIYGIARKFGIKPSVIMDANDLTASSKLYVGQQLKIQSSSSKENSRETFNSKDGTIYTVEKGDSIYKISKKFGVSMQCIREANSLYSDKLLVGQKLTIPASCEKTQPSSCANLSTGGEELYVVVSGDNISTIAKKFGVKSSDIIRVNNLQNPDKLKVGQQLKIPSKGEVITKSTTNIAVEHTLSQDGTYTVVSGDSLSSIAKRFGVKTSDIIRANNMQNPDSLRIGQKLHIPNKTDVKIAEKQLSENETSAVAAAKSNSANSDKKSEKNSDKSSESSDDFFENFEKIPVVEISK